jgi:hypothetical protein
MRVFLVQTAKGLFSSSGGYRANICLLRYLASRGHHVRQLCYSYPGETETCIQSMVNSGGRDPHLRKKLLRLRAEDGGPGTNMEVSQFIMDDGVEMVALDSKAFDEAFGGKKNLCKEISRETADYITVISPWSFPIVTSAFLTLIPTRTGRYHHGYTTLFLFCNRKSRTSRPHTSSATMACP